MSINSNPNSSLVKPEQVDIVLKKPSITFQKALQQARMNNKMSQKDLALKMGLNVNVIINYEKGKDIPSNLIISKIEIMLKTKLPRIQKG